MGHTSADAYEVELETLGSKAENVALNLNFIG